MLENKLELPEKPIVIDISETFDDKYEIEKYDFENKKSEEEEINLNENEYSEDSENELERMRRKREEMQKNELEELRRRNKNFENIGKDENLGFDNYEKVKKK